MNIFTSSVFAQKLAASNPSSGGVSNPAPVTIENPLAHGSTFCDLLATLFNIALEIAVPVAVLCVVYAGLKFVLARGNPDGLKAAKINLMYTIMGIALFFGAWFLAQIIAKTLVALGGNTFDTCF